MVSLNEMEGIKPKQLKILQENGINSIESLAMSIPESLAEINGLSEKSARQLVWKAREMLGMGTFKKVSEIQENFQYITTGSKNLDLILTPLNLREQNKLGGISTGRITEFFGPFKSGKTNICHTLCVTTQLSLKEGGLGGAVLYIDTENTFAKQKIERISKRFGKDPNEILSNIYHARIYSSDHQFQMIKACEKAVQEKDVKLIIIDSLLALLRSEYIGIGLLARRQQILNQIIHELSRIAETYNIAIVVTNQVATVMKGTFSIEDAIGGNIMAHGCHFRISLRSKGFSMNSSLERTATICDAPDLPPETATFFITEAGVSDTATVNYESSEYDQEQSSNEFELVAANEVDAESQIKEEEELNTTPKSKSKKLVKSKVKAN